MQNKTEFMSYLIEYISRGYLRVQMYLIEKYDDDSIQAIRSKSATLVDKQMRNRITRLNIQLKRKFFANKIPLQKGDSVARIVNNSSYNLPASIHTVRQ